MLQFFLLIFEITLFLLLLDCEDIPDYEKKRLENIVLKEQFFNANVLNSVKALKVKQYKPFACPKCSTGFATERKLKNHECYQCKNCKKHFISAYQIINHYRKVHGEEFKLKKKYRKSKRKVKRLVNRLDSKSLKYHTTAIKRKNENDQKKRSLWLRFL